MILLWEYLCFIVFVGIAIHKIRRTAPSRSKSLNRLMTFLTILYRVFTFSGPFLITIETILEKNVETTAVEKDMSFVWRGYFFICFLLGL